MSDAGLNDEAGFDGPNHFLKGGDVLRVLNYWTAQPFEMIGIFVGVGLVHPFA